MLKTRVVPAALAAACLAVLPLAGCQSGTASESPVTPVIGSESPVATGSTAATPSAGATPSASPTPTGPRTPSQVSTNLDAIKVTGEKLKAPEVTVPAPWAIDKTQTRVLDEGTGATVADTSTVDVFYYGVDGATGQKFDENYTAGQTVAFPLDQVVAGFKKGLAGQKVGSRVLIAMPGSDGYDASGGQPSAGIEVGDSLIFVVDIVGASLTEPQGEPQKQDPADPQVAGDAKQPTVTIPSGYTAPTETVSKVIIAGHGQAVKATDTILVNYQTVSLKTGQVVEQSYGKAPEQAPLSRLIEGWKKGLEGKTVGSRVLLVVPAKDAYGSTGLATPSIAADDTLVFVVDILYVTKG